MKACPDSPGPAGPKFRRRAEHRPDEVLDAAIVLFTDQGFAATSVEAIARKAGISKGAVYLYFPSKQAILEGIVTRAVEPISAQVIARAAAHTGSVRETLTVLMTMLGARLSDPDLLRIPKVIMREAVIAPDIADMYRHAVLDRAIPALVTLIRAGIASGELREVDPEFTVRSIMGPLIMHIFLSEIFDIRPVGGLNPQGMIENHLKILFDGLAVAGGVANE